MKKVLIALAVFAAICGWLYLKQEKPIGAGGGSGIEFWYSSATTTQYTVGTSWWNAPSLPQDSSRGYAMFCNNSVVTNNFIYLGLGATTTGPSIQISPATCYEMN